MVWRSGFNFVAPFQVPYGPEFFGSFHFLSIIPIESNIYLKYPHSPFITAITPLFCELAIQRSETVSERSANVGSSGSLMAPWCLGGNGGMD